MGTESILNTSISGRIYPGTLGGIHPSEGDAGGDDDLFGLALGVNQGDTENPFAYLIQMNFDAPDRPGVVRGTTIMTTDVEDETRIQLLFFGMIRPPAPEVDPNAKRPAGPDFDPASTSGSKGNKGGGK